MNALIVCEVQVIAGNLNCLILVFQAPSFYAAVWQAVNNFVFFAKKKMFTYLPQCECSFFTLTNFIYITSLCFIYHLQKEILWETFCFQNLHIRIFFKSFQIQINWFMSVKIPHNLCILHFICQNVTMVHGVKGVKTTVTITVDILVTSQLENANSAKI